MGKRVMWPSISRTASERSTSGSGLRFRRSSSRYRSAASSMTLRLLHYVHCATEVPPREPPRTRLFTSFGETVRKGV
jgi:hypothetical protein